MAIEATGVENVMGEVAHFWQLRKFQFIEEGSYLVWVGEEGEIWEMVF